MVHDNIKKFRLDKNWTQEDLAEKLNVTRQTISKWEQGINEPDIATLKKLSEAFEISIDELIGKEELKKDDQFLYVRKILNVVSISLCIFLSLTLIIFTRYLYNKIPMQFNSAGEINRWGSKWEWLFMLVGFVSVLASDLFACHLVTKQASKAEKATVIAIKTCCWICQIIFIAIFFGFAIKYLKKDTWFPIINGLTYSFLLSLFIFLHPSIVKQNRIFGFRTHFTCANENAWNKVNKMAFYVLNLNCILCIVLQLLYNQYWYNLFISQLIFVGCGIMAIYHIILKHKLK